MLQCVCWSSTVSYMGEPGDSMQIQQEIWSKQNVAEMPPHWRHLAFMSKTMTLYYTASGPHTIFLNACLQQRNQCYMSMG